MEKFSIIIPTMWKSDLLFDMLPKYEACQLVSEVIIINNAGGKGVMFDIYVNDHFKKVKTLFQVENIYVNPAWNLGVAEAKHTPILANDDIYIDDLPGLLFDVAFSNFDLIGATVNMLSAFRGIRKYKKEQGFPRKSFGCFMVCRKFVQIPAELRILCGDNWLFEHAETVGLIGSGYIQTPISVTIRTEKEFEEIGNSDKAIYKQLMPA